MATAPGERANDASAANWQQPQGSRADAAIQADDDELFGDSQDNEDDDQLDSTGDQANGEGEAEGDGASDHDDDIGFDADFAGQLIDELPLGHRLTRRKRSISLDAFLNNSIIRDVGGERLIISRGWPPAALRRHRHRHQQLEGRRAVELELGARRDNHKSDHHHQHHHHHRHHQHNKSHRRRALSERRTASSPGQGGGELRRGSAVIQAILHRPLLNNTADHEDVEELLGAELAGGRRRSTISEHQKRRLLIEYLQHNPGSGAPESTPKDQTNNRIAPPPARPRRLSIIQRGQSPSQLIVQYDVPVNKSKSPIVLGEPAKRERKTDN